MFGVLIAFVLLNQPIAAEVGNTGGFGGGSSGGGGSGGGSGGFGSLLVFGGGPGVLIIVILGVLIYRYMINQNSGNQGSNRATNTARFNTTPLNESSVVDKIIESDPAFSAEKFKGYVGELYITLQEAWEAKDWKIIRPFESNTLFNMHNKQLQEYVDKNWTNHMDMQDVRLVTLADYHIDGNQEVLSVRVNAACIDYTTDDNTGKVINGDERALQERSYRFEFIRSVGVKTRVEEGLNPTNCPNCGAPTQVTSSGECEYCHSVITSGEYGWVLNKYSAW